MKLEAGQGQQVLHPRLCCLSVKNTEEFSMGTDRTAYRRHSEIWNFNKGMITKVDHAINSIRQRKTDVRTRSDYAQAFLPCRS